MNSRMKRDSYAATHPLPQVVLTRQLCLNLKLTLTVNSCAGAEFVAFEFEVEAASR
jgi:hypothetical protein